MQIDDDVETCVTSPSANLFEILKSALWKVFAIGIQQTLQYPIAYRNSDGIQTITLHLSDVGFCDPGIPVVLEDLIGLGLAKQENAIELGFRASTPHVRPCR